MAAAFSSQFRLSITKALRDQLAEELKKLTPAPLTRANLVALGQQAVEEKLTSRSGVYQLYQQTPGRDEKELVYVGKADQPLPSRLGNHLVKISGRRNISIDDIYFKCLYVAEDFSAVSPEKLLIKLYKQDGQIPWNANGFGNKDPGRNRDRTVLKSNHFDVLYPIDLDRTITGLSTTERPLGEALKELKEAAPFNFRFQERATIYKTALVSWPSSTMTVDGALRFLAAHLPTEWQIVAFMGYVIMYQDHRVQYPSSFRYYRGSKVLDCDPQLKAPGKVTEDGEEDDEDASQGRLDIDVA
ncbi:GIY-YIG nuclease family protein [Streptomyces sp. HUAS CX7]|uniref:GIY-YIG nuclease family protein n=1 Tax=Streptomyces sp. HUAS CX7 TaxID=3062782 RepID=UPI0026F36D3D|nr:GIY-YIG nuclease family protein [Streptomyces sp. HUAS CX7]WKX18709.1 GIY-YIG nuclease family protein [Streptomyces sp. HUAS CX7]